MWLVKTKWYHTFIYVYWILIQPNTLRILWICNIFIFHILDWTIEDQQQQCWFVVLGRGCVWQLVAQNGKIWKTKQKTRPKFGKTRCLSEASQNQTKDKTHMTEPPINRLFISSTDLFSACHWWVCCPSTTGYIVVVEHRWMSTVLQVLHQQTNFLNSPSSSAMSSCVHPRFATVGILRQSYPQVGNCEKHGYEMKSINFIELKMEKKGSNTNITLSEWIQWEMPKIRKDHPITIYSKMFFSGSERNTTLIAASHCRFPSWPPRFQIPSSTDTFKHWCISHHGRLPASQEMMEKDHFNPQISCWSGHPQQLMLPKLKLFMSVNPRWRSRRFEVTWWSKKYIPRHIPSKKSLISYHKQNSNHR